MSNLPVVRDYILYGEARIKDRRTGHATTETAAFLSGRIDTTLDGLIRYRAEKRKR